MATTDVPSDPISVAPNIRDTESPAVLVLLTEISNSLKDLNVAFKDHSTRLLQLEEGHLTTKEARAGAGGVENQASEAGEEERGDVNDASKSRSKKTTENQSTSSTISDKSLPPSRDSDINNNEDETFGHYDGTEKKGVDEGQRVIDENSLDGARSTDPDRRVVALDDKPYKSK